ncbi:putative transcription factor bZIP family [Helianthus annuus]|uniref:Putative basic leucine-zipper 6 n=1 Tax=Helianthus annuus TaxID=4232 RepID=A0A251U9T5_HELAN|nr:basic leucine zipper 4 [Helianthus annuus]KAF5798793.1 putative transcription factor bZIP family [Helianthus annuus]KAJ0550350.1 putative transcription factor bZIP family [Helianthus annuus]KAJ0557050.1 putative transcription factor bZIP family [Helianthus annuus]KAJ0563306.1 putative transcription factor bZIP family [Helianthus annuus]KAJ0728653.1 putative transcription factor bZIP family [Helianthus annuus]
MLSLTFPAAVDHLPSDPFFATGFDPWATDTHETPFFHPTQEPVFSFSDDSTQKTNTSNSDAGTPAVVNPIDERKQRRMISNRESARRSRMRKQKHLENLRNLVNRHKAGNRDLTNRLRFISHQEQILRRENERLKSELGMLRQKLWDLHQVMRVWQLPNNQFLSSAWPCNNNNNNHVTSYNEQIPPSLIT